eukprot:5795688-Amphidinium_carterae.2
MIGFRWGDAAATCAVGTPALETPTLRKGLCHLLRAEKRDWQLQSLARKDTKCLIGPGTLYKNIYGMRDAAGCFLLLSDVEVGERTDNRRDAQKRECFYCNADTGRLGPAQSRSCQKWFHQPLKSFGKSMPCEGMLGLHPQRGDAQEVRIRIMLRLIRNDSNAGERRVDLLEVGAHAMVYNAFFGTLHRSCAFFQLRFGLEVGSRNPQHGCRESQCAGSKERRCQVCARVLGEEATA